MSHIFGDIELVTYEGSAQSLRILKENFNFANEMRSVIVDQFGRPIYSTTRPLKIGDTIMIRKPVRFSA